MSLRTDIKDAIDDVTPPALGLENRVTAMVLADGKDRRVSVHVGRRSPWNIRFRGMGALAAAALVVVLIAGFVIGGRVWRDWGNGNLYAASSLNQSDLHDLEARPLGLSPLQPGAACPFTPDPLHYSGSDVWGSGPVYLLNAGPTVDTTARGDWLPFRLAYLAERPGQVLVRGRDLSTGLPLVFTQATFDLSLVRAFPAGPNGAIAAGPVLGTDRLNNKTIQVHPEAVLVDPWRLEPDSTMPPLVVLFPIPITTLCWGLQFDGPGFSETYVNGWDTADDKTGWR